jgi:hypothetical protein
MMRAFSLQEIWALVQRYSLQEIWALVQRYRRQRFRTQFDFDLSEYEIIKSVPSAYFFNRCMM